MPFVNEKQRRLCYLLQSQALKSGKKPKWNCKKYGSHKSKSKSPKIVIGPRGGRYRIKNGRRIYL